MQTWAIANEKGGVGKTTSTLCLARGLVDRGHRVLVVDLDPNASLTRAFAIPRQPPPQGTNELFLAQPQALAALARNTAIDGLRVVAAQAALATLERRSASQPGLGRVLGGALASVAADYGYALLDCPPTLGLLMVNALAAADRLVVPTQADPLALHGVADMMRTAAMVIHSRRRPIAQAVVPTMVDLRTKLGRQGIDHLVSRYGAHAWDAFIPVDTALRDARAIAAGAPLAGRGAEAYAAVLEWLLAEPHTALHAAVHAEATDLPDATPPARPGEARAA